MRRPPFWRQLSAASSATASPADRKGRPSRMRRIRRRSVDTDALQPAADGPHGLLREDALERRHVDAAIAHGALAHALQDDLVTLVASGQVAQVGRDTARNGAQTMAAGAVLVEGRVTDADGHRIVAIGVAGQ